MTSSHHHHGHSHDHDHGHSHGQDHHRDHHTAEDDEVLEAQNKKHWDERAESYEDPASTYMTEQLTEALYTRFLKDLDSKSISLLDYACGPGIVSYKLLEQRNVKKIVGADVSTGMVELFNRKGASKGFSPAQAHAVTVSKHGLQEALKDELFDVVMCNHAYHHFNDVKAVTATLAAALKPGGLLLVADFLATEKPFLGHDTSGEEAKKHGVHHAHGFKPERLQAHFEEAGLINVKTDTGFKVSKLKLKELGGDDSPLKGFLKDAETNPDVLYVLASGQKPS